MKTYCYFELCLELGGLELRDFLSLMLYHSVLNSKRIDAMLKTEL